MTSDIVRNLCDVWFREYHPWCPILHQESVVVTIRDMQEGQPSSIDVLVKAIAACTVKHSTAAIILGYSGRRQLSNLLRSQVLSAIGRGPSLKLLQALVVIAVLDCGAGNLDDLRKQVDCCWKYV